MGLRDTLKKKLSSIVDRLSGEYSAVAPDPSTVQRLERPGKVDENIKVTRARLRRPPGEPDEGQA